MGLMKATCRSDVKGCNCSDTTMWRFHNSKWTRFSSGLRVHFEYGITASPSSIRPQQLHMDLSNFVAIPVSLCQASLGSTVRLCTLSSFVRSLLGLNIHFHRFGSRTKN
ncbi:Protein of unknown function [Pyronema omphalodes CBS 100304]|uniref:Uncharacterized protein n=1 Tax=Pyronema omphalodes (strain CBS 100304) TaxID=1076935 RepID=U4LYH9_PYROM|nr:Protein of unknown function [Pyronema omphalodes CBS 100304]